MQRKQSLANLIKIAACAVLALGMMSTAQAADADKKSNPTGTWSWTTPGRQGGEPRKSTLTLKADGENLTGKVSAPGRQGAEPRVTDISEGKVKGNEISFTVKREAGGNTFVQKFTGKVEGDTIKGKLEMPGRDGGDPVSRDWEAKREAAEKK